MLHFLEKVEKIAAALGAPSQKPRWPPADEGGTPRPASCYSHSTYVILLSTDVSDFLVLYIVKITTC